MKHFLILIALAIVTILFSSCSWAVNLVIANISKENIMIEYLRHSGSDAQFFASPKTYHFDKDLASLWRNKIKPVELTTHYFNHNDTERVHIILNPGGAAHIGKYYSFQDTGEIIKK